MRKLVVVWVTVLCLAGGALTGCTGSREAKVDPQSQSAAILKPAMVQALEALDQVTGRMKAGDTAGAKAAYLTFATAFGMVLGPVSLKDPQVAQRMANANSAMKRALSAPGANAALIAQEAAKITLAIHQSAEILGMPLLARAAAQGGAQGDGRPAKTVEVHAKEYRFTPERIEVPKGTRLTIRLVNNGTKRHEWELDTLGVEIRPVNPGAVGEVTFVVDRPGIYEFVCRVDEHDKEGMRGHLVIK